MELRVTRARRIFSDGTHNAFTGIVRWGEQVLVSFRSGRTHVTFDGVIRVIAAEASRTGCWPLVTEKALPGWDLRDPKLAVFRDQVLLFCGARSETEPLRSYVCVSADGAAFGDLQPLAGLPAGYWLWAMKPCGDRLYGTAYRKADGLYQVGLVVTDDGVNWEPVADFPVPGNEVGLDFDASGKLWALVREDSHGCVPALCTAEPPYTTFQNVTRLPVRLQGPMLKRLEGACVIAGRRWDNPGRRNLRTDLFLLEDGHDLTCVRSLPSGGDTSYAGWLDVAPGRALVSYYSSHEHKMDIGWVEEDASSNTAAAEHSTAADIFLADVQYRAASL